MTSDTWMDAINFNEQGLVPAIAQDKETGKILMMAWMNQESIKLTAQTKTATYYSRSRQKLWRKGETSGHTQVVHDIFLDCDADALILLITQTGNIACHTGRQSCFYKRLDVDSNRPTWHIVEPVIKNPKSIYNQDTEATSQSKIVDQPKPTHQEASDVITILSQLDTVLRARKQAESDSSYVASLYAKGINKILEKVGEEAVETIIAAKELSQNIEVNANEDELSRLTDDLIYEIADVWFHTLVTLAWFNVASDRVLHELARRFGLSGIAEKAARQ